MPEFNGLRVVGLKRRPRPQIRGDHHEQQKERYLCAAVNNDHWCSLKSWHRSPARVGQGKEGPAKRFIFPARNLQTAETSVEFLMPGAEMLWH